MGDNPPLTPTNPHSLGTLGLSDSFLFDCFRSDSGTRLHPGPRCSRALAIPGIRLQAGCEGADCASCKLQRAKGGHPSVQQACMRSRVSISRGVSRFVDTPGRRTEMLIFVVSMCSVACAASGRLSTGAPEFDFLFYPEAPPEFGSYGRYGGVSHSAVCWSSASHHDSVHARRGQGE